MTHPSSSLARDQHVANETHPGALPRPAPSRRAWFALALLCAAQFMLILDITVVNIALPELSRDLAITGVAASGAITAYVVPFGGLLLVGGRFADLFGARRLLLIGIVIFTAASLSAGFADDATTLFIARAFQGAGAAMLSPSALATVTSQFAGPERHRALAVWGAVGATGASIGVLLSGLLTAGPGWRWIFFVNVPVGLFIFILIPLVVRARPASGRGRRLDLPGAVLATAGTGSLIYGITAIGQSGRFTVVASVTAGVALFVLFAIRERRARDPLISPSITSRRPVQAGVVVMLAASGLLVSGFFLLSFALQAHAHWSPLATGLGFLPVAVGTLVGANLAGHLIGTTGPRLVAAVAFSLATLGTATAALGIQTTAVLIGGVAVAALGLGASFVTATTTAMSPIEHQDMGVVSGIINTFHELGGALGLAVFSAIAATSIASPATTNGFCQAFGVAAATAAVAAVASLQLIPRGRPAGDAPRFLH
jgi:EmrB/QacA subfamily drug resistance transporter